MTRSFLPLFASALFAAVLFGGVLAFPSLASAHPEVERARQLVLDGDYDAARPALDAALARDDLDVEDLIELLEARALLFHGLSDRDALDRTLRSLASFAPTHRFGPRFPPDLAARSVEIGREMRGRLRVVTRRVPSAVGLRLEANVENDGASLVRELRYRVFDSRSGQWQPAIAPIEASAGRELLVVVEAIGPGGAVLARDGSPDAPVRLEGPSAVASEDPVHDPANEAREASIEGSLTRTERVREGRGGLPEWVPILLGVGGALVVGAIVAGSIYAVENPTITWQPSTPTEVRP
jgi:hypothetical protein